MGKTLNLDEVIHQCRTELDRANRWCAQHQRDGTGNICLCTRTWPCEVLSQVASYAAHWQARLDRHEETRAAMKAPTAAFAELSAQGDTLDENLLRRALAARYPTYKILPMQFDAAELRRQAEARWPYRLWWRQVNWLRRLKRAVTR